MMWTLPTAAFLVHISSSLAQAQCALSPPVELAIRNITLPNSLLRRGVALSAGTPAQPLAFAVSSYWNNSYIHDGSSPCDSDSRGATPIQCGAKRGGFFDEGSSATWKHVTNKTASGANPDNDGKLFDDLWGTENLNINATFSVEDVPISIVRSEGQPWNPTIDINMLGLGNNSTFMAALSSANAIASKTWGLALGWQGADASHQTDGSLVLGGFDAARTNGTNATYPFSKGTPCSGQLVVTVSDISLNFKNGTTAGLLPPSTGSAIRACLSPDIPWMTIPLEYWLNFLDLTDYAGNEPDRSRGLSYWGMNFLKEEVYDGDLTIRLSPGLDIRIPNHQLVIPDYSVNSEGFIVEANSSAREILINSLQEQNMNDMPSLGRPFFSSAYLLVDEDNEQFTLWNSNPTATEKQLVRLGPACSSGSTITPASPPTDPSPEASSGNTVINSGGIAGIVIGSLAGLGLVALLLFRYYRRHHRLRSAPPSAPAPVPASEKDDARVSSYLAFKPEMPTDRQPPQELPLEQHTGYTVQPYEMAAGSGTGLLEQGRWSGTAPRERRADMTHGMAEMS